MISSNKQRKSIALAKPLFDGSELEGIQKVLESGWVTQGPVIGQFEKVVADYVGAPFAVASSNCTTAMHLGWLAMNIGKGDDVLCPSYSFIASANAVRHAGAEPVFADIDAETWNIDAEATRKTILEKYDSKLKNKATGNTLKAVLVVHQIGIPCDLDKFAALSKEFGIPIVEDAACAIGSIYDGTKIGGSGNLCAFSFHPRKVITTGEGGMLTCSNAEIDKTARVYRAHGMSVSDLARHQASNLTFENYDVVGYNFRMTDIQASIGISQFKLLESIVEKRIKIGQQYNDAFSKITGIKTINLPDYISRWNYQSYPVTVKSGGAELRNKMMAFLEKEGVSTRRGIPPIHLEPAYRAHNGEHLTNTVSVSESSFFIPIYPQLEQDDIEYIIDVVRNAAKEVIG